jgi:hypothetical protein
MGTRTKGSLFMKRLKTADESSLASLDLMLSRFTEAKGGPAKVLRRTSAIVRGELLARTLAVEVCPDCNGSGEGMHDGTKCRTCGGSGAPKVVEEEDQEPGDRWDGLS